MKQANIVRTEARTILWLWHPFKDGSEPVPDCYGNMLSDSAVHNTSLDPKDIAPWTCPFSSLWKPVENRMEDPSGYIHEGIFLNKAAAGMFGTSVTKRTRVNDDINWSLMDLFGSDDWENIVEVFR